MKNFNIITQLVDFNETEYPNSFLINAVETIGKDKLIILIRNLLFWQKIVFTSPTMAKRGKITNLQYYLLEDDLIISDYNKLFKACIELNDFFVLKQNKIVLNEGLSIKDIYKLRKIIDEGYELELKINIGKGLK
ncbi:hypothetical protein [Chryseobacterium geocarposphaerae]|uniref:Uncharacterized protein n=1 Tax=Chryseobacterium geocarposphaerae TaxID=1416776 RepID=A0A2M9C1R8_9FLAO|nr:hypothetical protein [Chryseobacterium geocarposphaerae]PJJ64357.1 hypothetical protein CLV73_2716 [Chryseobacterium geocarposphaerae]